MKNKIYLKRVENGTVCLSETSYCYFFNTKEFNCIRSKSVPYCGTKIYVHATAEEIIKYKAKNNE
jgi:hypothetical protein